MPGNTSKSKTDLQTKDITKTPKKETPGPPEIKEDSDTSQLQPENDKVQDDPRENEAAEGHINKFNFMNMANIVAENLAKEAKLKASVIISKNERVQQEFDGVGMNVEEKNEVSEINKIHNEAVYAEGESEQEEHESAEPLTHEEIKKKIMNVAKPVMLVDDEELMKKLKEKYNQLSNE